MADLVQRLADSLAAHPVGPPLELLCRGAVAVLGVSACAVVLMSDHDDGSVAAAYGPDVAAVEDLQFTLGEGPCLAAFRDGVAVLEEDIGAAARRWPAFAPAAARAGAKAVYALPMQIGAIRLGVLYLVADRPGPLEDGALADALTLTQLATTVVLDGQQGGADVFASMAASDGWSHRAVVHQATGMVSAQLDVGLVAALTRLRDCAAELDRTLYEVAVAVIGRQMRFSNDGHEGGQP